MKLKFIQSESILWRNIFVLNRHTQPDYPLLLPFINAWSAIFSREFSAGVTLFIGVLFSVLTGGLLFAGLALFINPWSALLAAGLIMFMPVYSILSTNQYADILLAYYLLCGMLSLLLTLKTNSRGWALLSGIFLGMLSFSKNEGMVMALLLAFVCAICILRKKDRARDGTRYLFLSFLAGLAVTGLPVFLLKCFLAPNNPDIFFNYLAEPLKYFNLAGLMRIMESGANMLFRRDMSCLGLFLLFLFVLSPKRFFQKEICALSWFFLLYGLVLVIEYLVTVHYLDLGWRLARSVARQTVVLAPAMIFVTFYVYWREN